MVIQKYEELIKEICQNNIKIYPQILKSKKFSYLWEYILSQTKFLQDFKEKNNWHFSIGTYVNWTLNHRTSFPYCRTCGKIFDKVDVNNLLFISNKFC